MRNNFLVAHWENLVVASFKADKQLLQPFVPRGTELNDWNGDYYMSLLGFQFSRARFCGIPSPFYRRFEELNLRFYVRQKVKSGWRKGVVFIKEVIPSKLVGCIAKWLYHENFAALPMHHHIYTGNDGRHTEYYWEQESKPGYLKLCSQLQPEPAVPGSLPAFIHDHYIAFTKTKKHSYTFDIQHPDWNIYPALSFEMQLDAVALYGEAFRDAFSQPATAFLLDGSKTNVSWPVIL